MAHGHGMMQQEPLAALKGKDFDVAFYSMMIPHHQAAVDMANTYLESGNDPELRQLAQHIVQTQQHEISQMQAHARPSSQAQSNHAH